jgi:hypothetical protein
MGGWKTWVEKKGEGSSLSKGYQTGSHLILLRRDEERIWVQTRLVPFSTSQVPKLFFKKFTTFWEKVMV